MRKLNEAGSLPAEDYVRLNQILALTPAPKFTWRDGVRTGRFPKQHKLGPRMSRCRSPLISMRPWISFQSQNILIHRVY
jgi:hypothetical protein